MQKFKTKSILTCWHVLQVFQNWGTSQQEKLPSSWTHVLWCSSITRVARVGKNRFPIVLFTSQQHFITIGCSIKVWLQQDSFRSAQRIPQIHTSIGVLAARDLWMPLVLSLIGGRAVANTRSDQLLLCLAESQELPRTESPWPLWVTCSSAAPASQWRSFSESSTWTCQAATCEFCPFLYYLPLLRKVCLRHLCSSWAGSCILWLVRLITSPA